MGKTICTENIPVDAFSGLEKFLALFYYNGERSFQCSPRLSSWEQQFLFVPSTKMRYRLSTGKTIQIHGRWWQRTTETSDGTSGVYNPFPTPELLYLIYFRQVGFRWPSTGAFRERFPHPSHHRTRKNLSVLTIGYFCLIPRLAPCLKLKGRSPFFSHQWDQRTVNHHPQHNSSSPPELCLAFSLCHGDHHCSTLPTNYLSSSFLTIFIHCLCHRLLEYPCLFLVIQFHDKTINPC